MTPALAELLEYISHDPHYYVSWHGAYTAVVRNLRTGQTRSLASMRQLYIWEHGCTPSGRPIY